MDKRKTYLITIDTETTNGMSQPLVYDMGLLLHDYEANTYEKHSFVIDEVFNGMTDLMKSAYYANKIPQYYEDIENGKREVVSFFEARQTLHRMCKEYNVKAIIAHNMSFDYRATTTTQRYLSKSKYRHFFPYGVELWDTMRMAKDTICKQKTYKEWCEENGFMTKQNKPQATAEVLYRYIKNENGFIEAHTALEDVEIEKEIFAHCIRQHKPMRKKCFND